VPANNTSERAEQRALREQMRGLGMSYAEIAAEMARRYRLRPRKAWRIAWGWTLEEAASRHNALRARDSDQAVTALTGSRLSEWENWPFSTRKPPVTGLCLLAEIYHCAVADLIDLHDRDNLTTAELITLDKTGAARATGQPGQHEQPVTLTPVGLPDRTSAGSATQDSSGRSALASRAGSIGALVGPVEHANVMRSASAAMPVVEPICLRLKGLSATQIDELTGLLDEQWHTLVKIDNLLGPRHALVGVRAQLDVIDALLRETRPPARQQVLRLGARYAESAAWLHEDSNDASASRFWTGRAMEWAVEASDHQMVSWTLFRRSQQATAAGDVAQAAGLAAAAQREAGELTGPMLAAILQQMAQAHALDGDEAGCHRTIDEALTYAASPYDPGDASNGHGSFCTPAYLEMQRGMCWLRLGRPANAIASFDQAIRSMPAVYRRDCGVALSGEAAAFAAAGEPEQAAVAASEALGIAQDAGSGRILNMIAVVADGLLPLIHLELVARLHAALAQVPAV
jgi:tetratricopeptide (TPR) repeat protein